MTSLRTDDVSSGPDHRGLMHSNTDFTPSLRQGKNKKAMSNSPSRLMSNEITMGASSTFDRLMTSMRTQNGGVSSSTRLQPQLTSSSLGRGMFANVMTGLDELLRHDKKDRSSGGEGLKRAMRG